MTIRTPDETKTKAIVIAIGDISRENRKSIVEYVETGCTKLYKLVGDDEVIWKTQFSHSAPGAYPGITAKDLARIYNRCYCDGRLVDHDEISKRANDLARAGLLLVVSKAKDPDNNQTVYKWRVSTTDEIAAMKAIGALEKNRVRIDWSVVNLLYYFIMPILSVKPVIDRFHHRVLNLYYTVLRRQVPEIPISIDGWLNEIVFRGVRYLGIDVVFKHVTRINGKREFLELAIKAIIDEGPPKHPGLGDKTLNQCEEYRKYLESKLRDRDIA